GEIEKRGSQLRLPARAERAGRRIVLTPVPHARRHSWPFSAPIRRHRDPAACENVLAELVGSAHHPPFGPAGSTRPDSARSPLNLPPSCQRAASARSG